MPFFQPLPYFLYNKYKKIKYLILLKFYNIVVKICSNPIAFHASLLPSHSTNTSVTCEQRGHSSWDWTKWFLRRIRVGKQSLQILHNKCFAFGGVLIFHIVPIASLLLAPFLILLFHQFTVARPDRIQAISFLIPNQFILLNHI
jgi:hypothetical protein